MPSSPSCSCVVLNCLSASRSSLSPTRRDHGCRTGRFDLDEQRNVVKEDERVRKLRRFPFPREFRYPAGGVPDPHRPPTEERDAPVLSALGNIAIQKGRPAEAKTWLTEAARLEPNSAEARMRLGRAEQANGQEHGRSPAL